MKKILIYILTVILLCGITVSCVKEETKNVKTEETVIMFFPYSGLEWEIMENIECMKTAIRQRKGLGRTRLVVYQALSRDEGILYEIQYSNGECHDRSISDVTGTFMSNDQKSNVVKLQSVLEKIKSAAPANGYSMVIGCHGGSWLPPGYYLGDFDNMAKPATTAFGTASANNQIANETLVEALQRSNMHLNFLIFDACYMMSVETAYDFRTACDYFIASQNEIMNYGIPYDHIGDAMLKHDYQGVVDEYYDFYTDYYWPYGSLSVLATEHLEALAAAVKNANQHISSTAPLSQVQREDGLTPTIFFDMRDYYRKFCSDANALKEVERALDAVVLHERHTAEFYTYFSQPYNNPASRSYGLNTSEPTVNKDARAMIRNTEWWRVTH